MQFTLAIAAAILAASADAAVPKKGPASYKSMVPHQSSNGTAVWITTTVTAYKTFCPESTTFTQGQQTYTATASQWVTVTACPDQCTVSWKPTGTPSIVPILVKSNVTVLSCPTGTVCPPGGTTNGTYAVPTQAPAPSSPSTVGSGSSSNPAIAGSSNTGSSNTGSSNTGSSNSGSSSSASSNSSNSGAADNSGNSASPPAEFEGAANSFAAPASLFALSGAMLLAL